jgi:hypothetical protein
MVIPELRDVSCMRGAASLCLAPPRLHVSVLEGPNVVYVMFSSFAMFISARSMVQSNLQFQLGQTRFGIKASLSHLERHTRFQSYCGDHEYNVEPMAWPLAQVVDCVASSLSTKTASPRAPASLHTRARPSSVLRAAPPGQHTSSCCSRSVFHLPRRDQQVEPGNGPERRLSAVALH